MTTEPEKPSRVEKWAPIVVAIAFAIPTLVARYLPMSDLPLHEGIVGMLRHFGDEKYAPRGLYYLNLGHPNQLFHILAWGLSYVVSTDWAVKLVVAAAQILIFYGGARFADHLGRSRWSALLLAPLALGFTFYWGLVTNLVGYAAFLLVLPALDRAMESPTPRRAVGSCVWLMLLYFAHESMFVQVIAVLGLFLVCQRFALRAFLLRIAPLAFGVGVFFFQQWWQASLYPRSQPVPPPTFFTFGQKVYFLPNVLFGSHDLPMLVLLVGLAVIAGAGFSVARIRSGLAARRKPSGSDAQSAGRLERLRVMAHRHRFELAALSLLVAYFVMPFNFKGATLLHERFLGPAWALGAVSLAPRISVPRIARFAAAALPVGVLLVSWPQFWDSDRTYRDLDPIIDEIPYGASVAFCIMTPVNKFAGRVYSAGPAPTRTLAVRGGRVLESLMMSPISPVMMREAYRWDDIDKRSVWGGSKALQPGLDLQLFGWIIVGSRDPYMRLVMSEALAPDAEVVKESGEWILLRSRHPAVPIMTPGLPENPAYSSMMDRVDDLRARDAREYAAKKAAAAGSAMPPPEPTSAPILP